MYSVMDNLSHEFSSKNTVSDRLDILIQQVKDENLQTMMHKEYRRLMVDQQRLVTMLEQRSDLLYQENQHLKDIISESQRRYEKAVREMQFFKRKYDQLASVAEDVESSNCSTSEWQYERKRNNSTTGASVFSAFSSSTEATSIYSSRSMDHKISRNPSMASSYSSPNSTVPYAPPLTPVRSTTSAYTENCIIQQRKSDPLCFGGSDALWDTIAKSQGSDVTVEKIISNFLRRGGSPNTAKQSPSTNTVKYGYGMIHALIVTKAPGALDLLLQQGANPNVMTLSQVDEDKVSPCYLAASVGWLVGLQKLVQAGGDLMCSRGEGSKKKTALHIAAERSHISVVEYIIHMTQGVLNQETDSQGANTLHYACASGHVDLVSFIIRACQIPVNQPDERGETPLHWAIRNGRSEVVALLIERYGADVNAYVSKKVGTPYDMAKSAGHKRLADYLKTAGGLTTKKMDKKREEELASQVPKHLESALTRNGFFMD